MVKKYVKKNDKIYEVREHEVTIENLEYDIEMQTELLSELELELEALREL